MSISRAQAAREVMNEILTCGWTQRQTSAPTGEICLGQALFRVASRHGNTCSCGMGTNDALDGLELAIVEKISDMTGWPFRSWGHVHVTDAFAPKKTIDDAVIPAGVIVTWNDEVHRVQDDVIRLLKEIEEEAPEVPA